MLFTAVGVGLAAWLVLKLQKFQTSLATEAENEELNDLSERPKS